MIDRKSKLVLLEAIDTAIKSKFCSGDVSDLRNTSFHGFLQKKHLGVFDKILHRGLNLLSKKSPEFLRMFSNSGHVYAQGVAVFIRGQLDLLRCGDPDGDLELCEKLVDWLIANRSPNEKLLCWGQPFMWYSRIPFPEHTPRATVSSQVAWAFIDLYEFTGEDKYLEYADQICQFFITRLNQGEDDLGNICFSYTTLDNFHIHNSNLMVAAVLSRVSLLSSNKNYENISSKAVKFTLRRQNVDGSWYYWSPPDKLAFKIDNYHTGFNLEALLSITTDYPEKAYLEALDAGLKYYLRYLFDGDIPKHTPDACYPIDIQACAQGIITCLLAADRYPACEAKAKELIDFTIANMYLAKKKHFCFQIQKSGKKDKSYYFRWGDSWMIRALSMSQARNRLKSEKH